MTRNLSLVAVGILLLTLVGCSGEKPKGKSYTEDDVRQIRRMERVEYDHEKAIQSKK